uniref:CKLF-like MARVEL transmembrane domain-containing protein 3 n=1 Tax=Urocitellus parryii TaxID=9999 RepID=UPI000E559FD0|nr:CKLF-like MARVEL transmembrane domain-containing protein 3 [Urocitellus parryii]
MDWKTPARGSQQRGPGGGGAGLGRTRVDQGSRREASSSEKEEGMERGAGGRRRAAVPGLRALLPARAFLCSLKGRLLLAESGLSFITFICYVVSSASAFLTVPLLEFLLALYFLFADAMQLNDKWQGLCWPFAIDFYLIFNNVAKFLKQGDTTEENTAQRAEEENSDSDSD